eukprot:c20870_g1_i1.p1 GENE.c20870_g1_i1~~c20870_g1_i1.p1  ORF type:complete len:326 (+),score=138.84 c20870_g1_i1:24-1001(+)
MGLSQFFVLLFVGHCSTLVFGGSAYSPDFQQYMNSVSSSSVTNDPKQINIGNIMEISPELMAETGESTANGAHNEKHLINKKKENNQLPDHLKHKTLTEIWKKETPCECPFHKWTPVCGVDGNTYPTECFAKCIDMPILVHADCKFVRKEIMARKQKDINEGKIPTNYEHELCAEEDDDDESDTRPKCVRRSTESDVLSVPPMPFPESDEQTQTIEQVITPSLILRSAQIIKLPEQQQPIQVIKTEEKEKKENNENQDNENIEWRVIGGMKVPYYTKQVENPCSQCSLEYKPVCGSDEKTYPNQCWADDCFNVKISHTGECDVVN